MAPVPLPTYLPSMMAKAPTHILAGPNPGPNPRGIPGSSYFECGPGGMTPQIIGPVLEDILGPVNVKNSRSIHRKYLGLRSKKKSRGVRVVRFLALKQLSGTYIPKLKWLEHLHLLLPPIFRGYIVI